MYTLSVKLKKRWDADLFNHKILQSINHEKDRFFKPPAEAYKSQHLMIHGVTKSIGKAKVQGTAILYTSEHIQEFSFVPTQSST